MKARLDIVRGAVATVAALVAGCTAEVPEAPSGVSVAAVRVPVPTAPEHASVYAEITNGTAVEDTLLAISSPNAAEGSLHRMSMAGGFMRMEPVPAVPLPAGETTALRSGDLHGMLKGLVGAWTEGDTVTVTFDFARSESVRVEVVLAPVGG